MVRQRKRVTKEDLEEQEVESKKYLAAQRIDLKFVLSHPQGRRFVWRLMKECKVFQSVWDQNLAVMNFKEGHRNVGLLLINWLNEVDPAVLYHIAMENQEHGD